MLIDTIVLYYNELCVVSNYIILVCTILFYSHSLMLSGIMLRFYLRSHWGGIQLLISWCMIMILRLKYSILLHISLYCCSTLSSVTLQYIMLHNIILCYISLLQYSVSVV